MDDDAATGGMRPSLISITRLVPKPSMAAIAAYLHRSGWTRSNRVLNGSWGAWERLGAEYVYIDVPLDETARDHARRVGELIDDLAHLEGRSSESVYDDIILGMGPGNAGTGS